MEFQSYLALTQAPLPECSALPWYIPKRAAAMQHNKVLHLIKIPEA